MPRTQSVMTTRRGEFRAIYRRLARDDARLQATPIVFCEGDSWFSTPLAMNLLDWLVFPTPEDEARGVPIFGAGGLFFRAEKSGDLATAMFTPRNIRDLRDWYDGFAFDIVLLSAGGNDFVDEFLKKTFARAGAMSVEAAFDRVANTGRYEQVREAYRRIIASFQAVKPDTPILAHTYDYPRLLGQPAELTLGNLGAAALLEDNIGPWIAPHIARALPSKIDQRAFAKRLIDGFESNVLRPLADDATLRGKFSYVDLRGTLTSEAQWFDEMHPTGAGFHTLAAKLRTAIHARLPAGKR